MFQNVRIAFFGTSEFSVSTLEALAKAGIAPDLVITAPDKPQGRKMILTPPAAKTWAEENSVEYLQPERLKDAGFLEKMKEYDLFIVASYGKIIPKALIEMPKYGVLNVHPSLLPKYRGPSPLQAQILQDEKNIGVSIMLIDEEVDHGPILKQEKAEIAGWPVGFHKLSEILAEKGAEMLAEILPLWIRGKISAMPQNHAEATFTKKIEKNDGFLDLNADAHQNYLKILAYEDWPGTYFEAEHAGKKMKVVIKKAAFAGGLLSIERVIPEGKKEMNYADFLRGLRG